MKSSFLVCAVVVTGCFEEGGDTQQTEAANTVAEAFSSFPELVDNLTSGNINATAAADSLTAFIKMPVGASNLLEQPFDASGSARTMPAVPPAPLPGCVTTSGTPAGCDNFKAAECEGGGFTFNTITDATRRCTTATCALTPPTADVLGVCDYGWNLDLGFANAELGITMEMNTTGSLSKDKDEITADFFFPRFTLTNGGASTSGAIRVCSCGPATVGLIAGKRRLINSQFVVKDFDTGQPQRCAFVEFDAGGLPRSSVAQPAACACANGTTCSGNGPT